HVEPKRVRASCPSAAAHLGGRPEQRGGMDSKPPLERRSTLPTRSASGQEGTQRRRYAPLLAQRLDRPAPIIHAAPQQPPEHDEANRAVLHPDPQHGVVGHVMPEGPELAEVW